MRVFVAAWTQSASGAAGRANVGLCRASSCQNTYIGRGFDSRSLHFVVITAPRCTHTHTHTHTHVTCHHEHVTQICIGDAVYMCIYSLDFVVNIFFMKLFRTSDISVIAYCREMFQFDLPSVL